ncbi:hypothetical protein HLV39_00370 [Marinobacter adhaerens]|uniref:Uncharacterized protein n=1 Tax=Marinobacter adhaerens TaxID=1033846 RepID=A0A851HV99_9GAMM|nr:hypothetical protein [Marinobacter adhaerens]NWN89948.1 hypothetical protein [Marinobacter adhaerens]
MRALVEIIVKVFAAYLAFSTVGNYVPLAFSPEAWGGAHSPHLPYLTAGLLVPIIISIVLWLKAPKIAKASFSTDTPGPAIPESGVVAAGVFLIGIYWLVRSISILVTQLGAPSPINYGWLVVLLLSVGLILGNTLIAKVFRKLRTAGAE